MGIQVEIDSILQEVNLDTMEASNMLVLRLPNDDKIKLPISADDVQRVFNARAGASAAPRSEASAVPAAEAGSEPIGSTELQFQTDAEGEPVVEFGGGGTQPEPKTEPEPVVASAPRRPRLSVTKDSYGYPVVRGMPGQDPGELVDKTAGNQDEDGVGSI